MLCLGQGIPHVGRRTAVFLARCLARARVRFYAYDVINLAKISLANWKTISAC